MTEPGGSEESSSAARARSSWLYETTGGQGVPSERSVAHPASKLAAIARTAARSLELVTLHLHRPPHILDALGITAGVPGAEKNCGDGSCGGKPPQDREHIAQQPALEPQPHQRRPLRRSS